MPNHGRLMLVCANGHTILGMDYDATISRAEVRGHIKTLMQALRFNDHCGLCGSKAFRYVAQEVAGEVADVEDDLRRLQQYEVDFRRRLDKERQSFDARTGVNPDLYKDWADGTLITDNLKDIPPP